MTEKVYYFDSHIEECEAVVLSCEKTKNGYDVVLDRTIIFPEGGGQLSDTGYIDDVRVLYAREDGDIIVHECESEIEKGKKVRVRFDKGRRLDMTQQHSGEHILSGTANRLFQATNVGFHMAEDYSTIDLDIFLDEDKIKQLEIEANRAVYKNIPVDIRIVDEAEYETIELRKKTKGLKGEIRVVRYEGVDSCTCCGTHCMSTGEVGTIKITSSIKYKGGTRIWFLCGERAIRHYIETQKIVDTIARRFSVKHEDVVSAVVRQGDELNDCKAQLKRKSTELINYRTAELLSSCEAINGKKCIVSVEKDMGMADLKQLAEKICSSEKSVAVIFSVSGDSVFYQLMRSEGVKLSMRELCNVVNVTLSGKGGGRDEYAQGSSKNIAGIEDSALQILNYLRNVIKNA